MQQRVYYCNVLAYYCSFHYHWHVYHYILLVCSFWACPPTISPWTRFYRFFSAALTEGIPAEGILLTKRLLILIIIINFMVKVPIIRVCWFFDQIFYPSYHKCEIEDPSFSYLLVTVAPQSWQAIKKMKKKTF